MAMDCGDIYKGPSEVRIARALGPDDQATVAAVEDSKP